MFSIDKQKFGAFVAMLRKEKGLTQKELAERLYISDKAVSKWETAASVPGIDLLIPLADIFGVTVTELLLCERMEQNNTLDAAQVEQVVKTAISYNEEEPARAQRSRRKWMLIYIFSFVIACVEMLFIYMNAGLSEDTGTMLALSAIFGVYFCFFAKTKLPAYYDENKINAYSDGPFRMNIPGISINNSNWGKILTVDRIWSITMMTVYPILSYIESLLFSGIWLERAGLYLNLFFVLGGLFIPIYIVGKKYE